NNLKKLVGSVTKNILTLSNTEYKLNDLDEKNIEEVTDNLSKTLVNFYNFLDYDNDGKVELVENKNGSISLGDDLKKLQKDTVGIIEPFLNKENNKDKLFIITFVNLLTLLQNENISKSSDKFKNL